MIPSRKRECSRAEHGWKMGLTVATVFFIGLNVVRAFSLISLILVFASTIFVMVTNIKAVNAFVAHKVDNSTMEDCDYIE